VKVTYLWTGTSAASGTVSTAGDPVTGKLGTSTIWDRIGAGNYITDTYVQTGSDKPVAPLCF
jgi:hypothetical protein